MEPPLPPPVPVAPRRRRAQRQPAALSASVLLVVVVLALAGTFASVADAACPLGYDGEYGANGGGSEEDGRGEHDHHCRSISDLARKATARANEREELEGASAQNFFGDGGDDDKFFVDVNSHDDDDDDRDDDDRDDESDKMGTDMLFRRLGKSSKKSSKQSKRNRSRTHKSRTKSKGSSSSAPVPSPGATFAAASSFIENSILTNSQAFWPADVFPSGDTATGRNLQENGEQEQIAHYGPLLIRLAWHCAGSYRQTDGRGGCDGGRIRYDPELTWEDNANLDKALRLLQPVYNRFGPRGLSWADLVILAGNAAIKSMGGPILGFCGGRVDDEDGRDSLPLGPSGYQETVFECTVNGLCDGPILGPTTVGLIYVNPAGPMADGDPEGSKNDIRQAFTRMGMNESETVALIGGGHSFGRMHGACPDPPCLDGKGPNAFTSGFTGEWTTRPTEWTNQYFENLLGFNWTKVTNAAENEQWAPEEEGAPPLTMLTSDIALLHDEAYLLEVQEYEADLDALANSFSHAWYKLTTSDMGPHSRCIGDDIPPPQAFQHPLPPAPDLRSLPDFREVRRDIEELLDEDLFVRPPEVEWPEEPEMPEWPEPLMEPELPDPEVDPGIPGKKPRSSHERETPSEDPKQLITTTSASDISGRPSPSRTLHTMFISLAYNCASTYRDTDKKGGCNGARIRYEPELGWHDERDGTVEALMYLERVKVKYPTTLSWADLIVLAGTVALERAVFGVGQRRGGAFRFCGGRVDAADGAGSDMLVPRDDMYPSIELAVLDDMMVTGLGPRSAIALAGRPRSMRADDWKTLPSNHLFVALLREEFTQENPARGTYDGSAGTIISEKEYALTQRGGWMNVVEEYAKDQGRFRRELVRAWTELMNADRFDGPVRNACDSINTPTL